MTANRGHWLAPLHRSRAGAAHRRRQTPCQDSALSGTARSRDGLTVQLMAVADGHGGSAYWLSDVGSRLACSLALEVATEGIGQRLLNQPLDNRSRDELSQWLSQELPAAVLQRWRTAVAADWQQRPEAEGQPPRPYGTTLGLVLLTPHWWAHTGLGDWDLVLLEQGEARLVSEERAAVGSGEATASLCLEDAARRFSERCGLRALPPPHGGSLSLVLSTDGIRKSCATDSDHLALCRFLAEASEPLAENSQGGDTDQLDESLDRISREGSGDDVSAAIAHYRPGDRAAAQPSTVDAGRLTGQRSGRGICWENGLRAGLLLGGGLLVLAGAGLALLGHWPQPRQARPTPPATPPIPVALQRQVQQLCEPPAVAVIEATLNQRKALFEQLAQPAASATPASLRRSGNGALEPPATAGRSGASGPEPAPAATVTPGPAEPLQHPLTDVSPRSPAQAQAQGPSATLRPPNGDGRAGSNGDDPLGELIRRSQPAAGSTVITTSTLPSLCPELERALQRRWQPAIPATGEAPTSE